MKIFYKFKKLLLRNKFTVRIPAGLFHFAYNMHRKKKNHCSFPLHLHSHSNLYCGYVLFCLSAKVIQVQPYIFCIQLPMSTTQFTPSLSLPPFPQCEFKCYDGCEISRSI